MFSFDAGTPFGGYKQSGIAHTPVESGLANCTEVQTVTVNL
jgi:acyl-CoA reductase-like NAD-dependent aldehyde dehydrogenase